MQLKWNKASKNIIYIFVFILPFFIMLTWRLIEFEFFLLSIEIHPLWHPKSKDINIEWLNYFIEKTLWDAFHSGEKHIKNKIIKKFITTTSLRYHIWTKTSQLNITKLNSSYNNKIGYDFYFSSKLHYSHYN
jgi:hypothetical protein